MAGEPELRWYQESWGVITRCEFTNLNPMRYGDRDTPSKLQAICLLHMYLGIYQQGSGELDGYSGGPYLLSEFVDVLQIKSADLLRAIYAAELMSVDDVRAVVLEREEEESPHRLGFSLRSLEEIDEALSQGHFDDGLAESLAEMYGWNIVEELIRVDNRLIYDAMSEHYGGTAGLFASIWNSRRHLDEVESVYDTVNSDIGEGKLTMWTYVEGGMTDWRATTG